MIVPKTDLSLISVVPKVNRSGLYHLATYDPDTFLVGDEIVSGTPTFVHTADIYQKDKDGEYGVFGEDERVVKGARRVLDPDRLVMTYTTEDATDLVGLRLTFNDGSTWGISKNDTIIENRLASGVARTFTDISIGDEIKLFGGNASALTRIYTQDEDVTGSLPTFSNYPALYVVYLSVNNFTGSIPSVINNSSIGPFYIDNNNLTGDLPDLSGLTSVSNIRLQKNLLTGYAGGWPNRAFRFDISDNALTETAVNLILTEADTYGIATDTIIDLSGGTNATPTGDGLTAKANLIANGATVTTN